MNECLACGGDLGGTFYENPSVPMNSCLLLESRLEALRFPRGSIELAVCHDCGFVTNTSFVPSTAEYSTRYEETQAFSPTFVDFGRDLAKQWVERYELHGKHVLEIGCGKGEFLTWMVEAGAGSGTGVDPGVHPERLTSESARRIEWIADVYDDRHPDITADAVVCRHTLEHIPDVRAFLETIRSKLGTRFDVPILFELPDARRVFDEVAFWDVYYEHCSYFTAGSLARLFRRCGFEVVDLRLCFDDQYLLVEAFPSVTSHADGGPFAIEEPAAELQRSVRRFSAIIDRTRREWVTRLEELSKNGDRAAIWGGGSKAVAFLSEIGDPSLVHSVVDINPHKQGRYIAGTDHRVSAPDHLVDLDPALVIVMNRVYQREIEDRLREMNVRGTVVCL